MIALFSVVDLTGEHSDKNEHEDEGCNRKNHHKDSLHKASHHVLRLVVYFFHLRVSFLDVFGLEGTHILYYYFVFFKLLLEALSELLHAMHHLKHVCL